MKVLKSPLEVTLLPSLKAIYSKIHLHILSKLGFIEVISESNLNLLLNLTDILDTQF